MKDISIKFPGGKRVDAHFDGHVVKTDQSKRHGGDGSAAEPFDLFFVSIATCVGIYVLEFCDARKIDTEGLGVRLKAERDPEKKLFTPIRIEISLPEGFPEKHKAALIRTANLCTVKRHIVTAPDFELEIV
jgi:ribosomal protein S12 methylthiotransferase accessory factor